MKELSFLCFISVILLSSSHGIDRDVLKTQISQLLKDEVGDILREYKKEIRELRDKLERHEERIKYLELHCILSKRVNEIQNASPSEITKTVRKVNTENFGLETRAVVDSGNQHISSPGQAPLPVIAFYAYMGQNEPNPSPRHTFVFDQIKTNDGSAYSHHTGIFTAPVEGTYIFSWTIFSESHGYIFSEAVVNSDVYCGTSADSGDSHEERSATGVFVVNLSPGDEVFIRTPALTTLESIGVLVSNRYRSSSFSGWMLS